MARSEATDQRVSGGICDNGCVGVINVINPFDQSVVGTAPHASTRDCLDAVDAAHAAFPTWRTTAPRARAEILRRAYELMTAEHDELARLVVRENGKVLADAKAEVTYAAEFFRWFSEEAVRIDGDYRRAPSGANWLLVSREPVGVSLLATPWNFPAAMATRKIGPALAAGCTVVLKPASDTPLTAIAICDILRRAGVPDGVVNVVVPDPPGDAVSAMLASGKVRKLSFTGSTETGRRFLRYSADSNLKKIVLECGGKNPAIVLEDAEDLDLVVLGQLLEDVRELLVVERRRHLGGDAHRVRHRELLLAVQPFGQGLAVHERHDIVEEAGRFADFPSRNH